MYSYKLKYLKYKKKYIDLVQSMSGGDVADDLKMLQQLEGTYQTNNGLIDYQLPHAEKNIKNFRD